MQEISVSQRFLHKTPSSRASLLSASWEYGNIALFLANCFAVYLHTADIFSDCLLALKRSLGFFEHTQFSSPDVQK